jgi:hypothetical protein
MDLSSCVRVLVVQAIVLLSMTATADVRSSDIAPWLPCFADLVTRSELNSEQPEMAAFLVDGPDGPTCVRWPVSDGRSHSATFHGSVPRGAFAIVHTHPYPLERPSRHDVRKARSLDMPIYVVSRKSIWVATESMESVPLIRKTNWRKELNLRAP